MEGPKEKGERYRERRTGVRIVVGGSTHAPNRVHKMEGLIARDKEKSRERERKEGRED